MMRNRILRTSFGGVLFFTALVCFADKNQDKGDDEFEKGNYREALSYYNEVAQPAFEVKERIAQCHYYLYEYSNAEKEFAEFIDWDGVGAQSYFMYAEILMNHADYKKAVTYFEKCKGTEVQESGDLEIESCEWALEHIDDRPEFGLQLLNIETGGRSMGVAPYNGGLIYAHPTKDEFMESTVYYDLSFANRIDSVNFGEPTHIATEFNHDFYEGAPHLSADGQFLYFTRNASEKDMVNVKKKEKYGISSAGVNTLEILVAERVEGKWANVQSLEFNDIEHSYTHPCISTDGNTLYFVSNREGGFGGYDLYRSEKTTEGWSEPVNLGPEINTTQNESFPHIANDRLYFSSKGHKGFGGYDVFYSTMYGDNLGMAVNAGIGINSSRDDFAIVFNKDGESGYISSNREGDNGYDRIYTFEKIIYAITIDALVKNKVSYKPIPDASVMLLAANGNELLTEFTDESGALSLELYPDRAYTVKFSKEGYEDEEIEIPVGENRDEIIALLGNIELEPVAEKDVVINLDNIYFDYGVADLRAESLPILDRLVKYLNDHPDISIELSAHTDCRASNSFNKKLSQDRAESCYDYLIKQGVGKSRMDAVGYGETRLLNKCADDVECSEDEHQINRRVEIKIL